jgi:hypothetical protein
MSFLNTLKSISLKLRSKGYLEDTVSSRNKIREKYVNKNLGESFSFLKKSKSKTVFRRMNNADSYDPYDYFQNNDNGIDPYDYFT